MFVEDWEIKEISYLTTSPDDIRRWMEYELARKIYQHIPHTRDLERREDDQTAAISYVAAVPDKEIELMRSMLAGLRAEGFVHNWPLIYLFRGERDKERYKNFLRDMFEKNADLEPRLGRHVWDAHFYLSVINRVPSPPYIRTYAYYIQR